MADRKYTFLDDPDLMLYGPKVEGGDKLSTFRIMMKDSVPHMVVRTGISSDKYPIEAKFNDRQFYNALETIREVLMHNGPIRLMIQNSDHKYIDGQRQKEPSPSSIFAVEKKEDGRVVMLLTAGTRRPAIEFDFTNNANGTGRVYHLFMDADRNPMPIAIASRIATRAYINWAEKYVAAWKAVNAEERKWMKDRRDNNGGMNGQHSGGGQHRPNNSGGGYQQQTQQSSQTAPSGYDMDNAEFF